MARIPKYERKMPPEDYLHNVPSYYGEKPLAWPVTEIVQDLIADARQAGFNAPYFDVVSGFRTYEHQDRLFQKALKKYGSVSAARKWVAPPGKSAHNTGYTFDLYLGGPIKSEAVNQIRRDPAYKYMRDVLAPKYNIAPYQKEPWHWECDKNCRATYIMNKYGLDGELARQIVDEEIIVPQGNMLAYLEETQDDSRVTSGQATKKKIRKVLLATTLVGAVGFGTWVFLKRRG
tara:strand:- start:132 stop:827 length:696 start_codon:yes stop_codon:yes gene_type:complete